MWYLVPRLKDKHVIGTKWILKNKQDVNRVVVRNKTRLVAQGYSQIERIDSEETFAPVARLESIRMFLAIACSLRIKLYQIDVNNVFLNEILSEEVYVEQSNGFKDSKFLNHVYRLKKTLYRFKKAPRAWYKRFITYFLEKRLRDEELIKPYLFISPRVNCWWLRFMLMI